MSLSPSGTTTRHGKSPHFPVSSIDTPIGSGLAVARPQRVALVPFRMRCPKCAGQEDRVIDSRSSKEGATIRRRRECLACTHRFTTYEEIEHELMMVIKRDGRREPFSREKLFAGIQRACQKRPVSENDITAAVERIMDGLAASIDREMPSQEIGARVMRELRALDPVAYIRFASIYREFEEITDFVEEARRLAALPLPDKRQMSFELPAERGAATP
jgi:transcriptional repressor NrdR